MGHIDQSYVLGEVNYFIFYFETNFFTTLDKTCLFFLLLFFYFENLSL